MTLTPRQKLVGAAVAALAVPVLAAVSGGSGPGAARVLLGSAALVGLVAWCWRARGAAVGAFRSTPRLKVLQRVGLSGRSALALVELDGRPWLVAHGDGFARLRQVPRPRRVGGPAVRAPQPASEPIPTPAARDTHAPTDLPRVYETGPTVAVVRQPPARVTTPAHDDAPRPSTRATRSPVRLAHLRLQDPLEDFYVASLVPPRAAPPARPSAPVLSLRPLHGAVRS